MSRFPSLLVFALLLGIAGEASAKDIADANTGCHLIVPDGWSITHPPAGNASAAQAANSDRTKSVLLYISTVSSSATIADGSPLTQGVESGLLKNNVKITSRDHRRLANTDFYVLNCLMPNGVQSQMWISVANGHMYEIGLYEAKNDPSKDTELAAALNSFLISPK